MGDFRRSGLRGGANGAGAIRLRPAPRWWAYGAAGLLCAAAAIAWLLYRPAPRAPAFPEAAESTILADCAPGLTVFRFAANPRILVLDFSDMRMQGLMLNRVAALVEKKGLPRDRVLTDAALAEAIQADNATVATYYYGHDYRAADLARFFALADAGHVVLDPEEQRLRGLLRKADMLGPGAAGALISIPQARPGGLLRPLDVATILHHELSHGAYFTDPAFAAFVAHFWTNDLTAAERDHFRRFLGGEGYDATNEDLMRNETQAYLVFTPNPAYFNAAAVGLGEDELAGLRARFVAGMPPGWLRNGWDRIAPATSCPAAPPARSAPPVRSE